MKKKAFAAWSVAIAVVALAADGRGADRQACVDAHEKAQVQRKEGHLLATRELLRACSSPTCPTLVVKDCSSWLDQVEREVPSIVVLARDGTGRDIADVRVWSDGALLVSRLDGKPFDVEPGQHALRFERSDGEASEQSVLVVSGEKGRVLRVDFPGPPSAAPPAPSSAPVGAPQPLLSAEGSHGPRIPTAAWVAGGVGVVALGAFAYFGATALARHSDYRSSCNSACSQSQADDVTALNRTADVSLGVALVSAGIATWLVLSRPTSPPAPSSAWAGASPVPGGGEAVIGGRF